MKKGPENGGNIGGGGDRPRDPREGQGGRAFGPGGEQPPITGAAPSREPRRPGRPDQSGPDRPTSPRTPRAENSGTRGSDNPAQPNRTSRERFPSSSSEPGYTPGNVGNPVAEGYGDVDPLELQDEPGKEFSQADAKRTTERPPTFTPGRRRRREESGTPAGDGGRRESDRAQESGAEARSESEGVQNDGGARQEGGRHQAPPSIRQFEIRSRGFVAETGHRLGDRLARRFVTPPDLDDLARLNQKRNTYLAKARVRRLPSSSTKFVQGTAGAVTSGAALAIPELMTSADPKWVAGGVGVAGGAWAIKGAKEWVGRMKDNIHLKAGSATAVAGLGTLASAEWKVATAAILAGSIAWAGKGIKNGIENGFLWPHYEKALEKANTKLEKAKLEIGEYGAMTRRLDEIDTQLPRAIDPRERRRLLREQDHLNRRARRRSPGFWKEA